jgi:hypothetical protein
MSNIWWAYDEENGSFSALPASPMLLPALGLFFLAAVFSRAQKSSGPTKLACEMQNVDHGLIHRNAARFHELLAIMKTRNLNDSEESELYRIQHPPWAEPGEVWTY